jgi:predicted nucleotidyltransferase
MPYLSEKEMKVVRAFCADVRKALGDNVVSITLFGSRARGEGNEESDIDLYVLLKKYDMDILEVICDILVDYQLEYDMRLAPLPFSVDEYEANKAMGSPFLRELEADGIRI